MPATTRNRGNTAKLLNIRSTVEIEFLVKESEVITGQRGRIFVIASADRLVYRVDWSPYGYRVHRIDEDGNNICTSAILPEEFPLHSLGEALRAGQLFTSPVNR